MNMNINTCVSINIITNINIDTELRNVKFFKQTKFEFNWDWDWAQKYTNTIFFSSTFAIPIVGDNFAGKKGEANDNEEKCVETRAGDEQTLPEKLKMWTLL